MIIMKINLVYILMFACSLNAIACSKEKPFYDSKIPPHISVETGKPEGNVIRLVSYNVGVFNKVEKNNYQTIANMMMEVEADAICLNELDSCTSRTGRVFQLKHFAGIMDGDWDYEFGPAIVYGGGKYGEGIATKAKAVRKSYINLPKGPGAEARVLVIMELEDYVIATTHLDHISGESQLVHVDLITKIFQDEYGDSKKPVFLGGDLNAVPTSKTMLEFQKNWTVHTVTGFGTYPSDAPAKCIDYIMQFNNGVDCEVIGAKTLRWFKSGDVTTASDHLPILIDFKLSSED